MVYRTMLGREVDLEKLMRENELMPAIGNMKVNARGDELGPGGVIIRKKEDIISAYYEDNPNAQPRQYVKEEAKVVKQNESSITKSSKKTNAEE